MNKTFSTVAFVAALMVSTVSFAEQPGNNGGGQGGCGVGQTTNGCGGTVGGAGGAGVGVGVAIQGQLQMQQQMQNQMQGQSQFSVNKNANVNANINANANRNVNANANRNTNNNASAGGASNVKVDVANGTGTGPSYSSIQNYQFPQIPVSTAWAPALAALAPAQCVLSTTGSGGAQFLTVGVSAGFGATSPYEECNVRETIKVIGSMPPGTVINGVPAGQLMAVMTMQLSGVTKALNALNGQQVAQVSPSAAPVPVAATAAQPAKPAGYEWCVAPLSVHTLPDGRKSCY